MNSARHVVFAPMDNTARVHAVVRRIGGAIALGLLADGEQLPSEAELAGHLGVSTVTLREALMALRQQGLIHTRRGRGGGSFVRSPARPPDLDERLRSVTPDELCDLGDHYAAVAGTTARLAARRASPRDVQRLRTTLDEIYATPPGVSVGRLDGRLHVEIATAARSVRLAQEEIRLQVDAGPLLWSVHTLPDQREPVAEEHTALVDAIERRDETGARAIAEDHILNAVELLIEHHLAA